MKKLSPKTKLSDKEYCQYLIDFYTSIDVWDYFDDFEKFVGALPGSDILDGGCGIGHFSHRLAQRGYRVISLDPNRYALEYGKKRGWITNPLLGKVEKIPLANNSIDAVFFLDVIEHLPHPSRGLQEINRVLKKEGMLYLITPNALYGRIFGNEGETDPTHIHEFSWWELKKFLQKNGFRVVRAQASGLPLINRLSHHLSRRMAKILGRIALLIASPSFWVEAKPKK